MPQTSSFFILSASATLGATPAFAFKECAALCPLQIAVVKCIEAQLIARNVKREAETTLA